MIGIRREPEINHPACSIEPNSSCLERTQILDGDRQSVGEFLCFRPSGIVHDARIGRRKRPLESLRGEIGEKASEVGGHRIPGTAATACRDRGADGINPKRNFAPSRGCRVAL